MQTAIERAFELARSGKVDSVHVLKKQLKRERFPAEAMMGPALSRQLRDIIRAARKPT